MRACLLPSMTGRGPIGAARPPWPHVRVEGLKALGFRAFGLRVKRVLLGLVHELGLAWGFGFTSEVARIGLSEGDDADDSRGMDVGPFRTQNDSVLMSLILQSTFLGGSASLWCFLRTSRDTSEQEAVTTMQRK